ncbi:MAG: response regulator [Desulfuromonadaceae bacterium]
MANVLCVDDSPTMRKIISKSLRQSGLAVEEFFEAGDGFEGLAVIASGKKIDLILADINMPNMDGLEFVKAVRNNGNLLPIVMITSEGGDHIIEEAISIGASDSIKKPFTPDQLQEKLGGYF